MQIVNWPLAKHPMNWITIWLMLFLAGFALHLVLKGMGINPKSSKYPAGYAAAPSAGLAAAAAMTT